jgi:hypothetical protein
MVERKGSLATRIALCDCPDDSGAVGRVLARHVAGRRLAQKAPPIGAHGGVVHDSAAALRGCEGPRKALLVESVPFFHVAAKA